MRFDSNFQQKFIQHLIQLSKFNYLFAKLTLDLIEKGNLIIKSSNFKVLPKNLDNLVKLYFNLKFSSRIAYDRLAMHIFAVCLSSFRPLTLEDIYESLNSAYLCQIATPNAKKKANFVEKISYNDIVDTINYLDGCFLSTCYYYNDSTRTPAFSFAHPGIRDWCLEYQAKNNDSKWGNFLLGMRFLRASEPSKPHSNRLLLEQIVYLSESTYLLKDFNLFIYLLSLKNSVHFYTSLLISNDFLATCDLDIFRILIRLGADYTVSLSTFSNVPFICVLARLGQFRLLSELVKLKNLKEETVYNYEDKNGTNCLSYATQYDKFECAKFLIENTVHPIQVIIKMDNMGYCALTYASESKRDLKHFLEYYLNYLVCNSFFDVKFLFTQSLVLNALNANMNCLNYLVSTFIFYNRPFISIKHAKCITNF